MFWESWTENWSKTISACRLLDGEASDLSVRRPASKDALREIEEALQIGLPTHFQQTVLNFASAIEFNWFLPKEIAMPGEFTEIFSGGCYWNLSRLTELEASRQSWIENCFPNRDDEYDKVWHDKLAFLDIPNGDMLALDLTAPQNAPVVYLSHDGGELHGCRLGENFIDFITRWSALGCPGAEEWQLKPFINSAKNGLEPDGAAARKWKKFFGI